MNLNRKPKVIRKLCKGLTRNLKLLNLNWLLVNF